MPDKKATMHPTGVQYPSLLTGELSPVEKTALKYIKLFDEALQAKGIHTLIGTEQEMLIHPSLKKAFSDTRITHAPDGEPYMSATVNPSTAAISRKFADDMSQAISAAYKTFAKTQNARTR